MTVQRIICICLLAGRRTSTHQRGDPGRNGFALASAGDSALPTFSVRGGEEKCNSVRYRSSLHEAAC